MKIDMYGQKIFTEQDLCNLFMVDPIKTIKGVLVQESITFDPDLELINLPQITQYVESKQSMIDFDQVLQSTWFIPDDYKNFDIAKFVIDKCTSDAELQRAAHELMMYQDKNMFGLLIYLKYLVDTMRKHNVVWGVGRGSSVASFVLFLIGIHKINSLQYDLSIEEFLK